MQETGKMTGEGSDGIGPFVISGQYSQESGECSWVKQYVGRHSVDYKGFREGKGIWGTWTVLPGKGGFKIWPLGEGEALKEAEVWEEVHEPATKVPASLPVSSTIGLYKASAIHLTDCRVRNLDDNIRRVW